MVVFCSCAYAESIPLAVRDAVLAGLRTKGIPHLAVRDLCELAADGNPILQEIGREPVLAIVGCYPRAVRGLFHMVGIDLMGKNVKLFNMREQSAEEILAEVRLLEMAEAPLPNLRQAERAAWMPWFPVIDRGRCRNCKQCLSFCLFGVYELSEDGRVEVRNPRNCKTNCPACARICPEAAIMFPKFAEPPINGAEIGDETVVREAIRVNVANILGDDVYRALAERRRRHMRRQSSSGETERRQAAEGASS